ncbi:cytochrome P450 [Raphidocelis subcapitata]|uniref:Cytochrome P450 n=1 Tax=Raphidocelis subcapitata TaxID=307507 RepID=A0A2V0PB78_9CHLO|nr:cytochrome P450 [Raphidocelis subcapitata]|eukprot:GBF96779.1 cytochrome P450 [Raphidocelis subcapitata]
MEGIQDAAAALLVAAGIVTVVLWALDRWKYRACPGPFALPLIGNLVPILKYGLHEYLDMCRRKYGRIFKIYLGSAHFFVVADPEVARAVNNRLVDRFIGPQLSADPSGKDSDQLLGLATANGEEWRALRLSWQPAFQSGSLERYAALMDECALRLVEQLAPAAAEGRAVDIWRSLGTMTMGVVGGTAFGVSLHTMDDASSPHYEEGQRLLTASAHVFSSSSFVNGSLYQPLLLIFPKAVKAVQWLAARLPDTRLVRLTKARQLIRDVSADLIADWRASAAAPGAAARRASEPSAADAAKAEAEAARAAASATLEELQGEAPTLLVEATAGSASDAATATASEAGSAASDAAAAAAADAPRTNERDQAAPAAGEKRAAAGLGVAPGSFLSLMLDRKARGGARFSDDVIIAQANTFILAGYETTANALSYAVYAAAANPRVQERLASEVDTFGRGRRMGHSDLAAFPYAQAVIKEALRLYPPAIMTNRRVTKQEGFELVPGVKIKKGMSIFTAPYCFHRDEAYWPRPLEFLPERFLPEGSPLAPTTESAWLAFGGGARMCVGWRFAMQEAVLALVRLFQAYTFELSPGQVPLKLRQGLTLSPAEGVWVTPVARGAADVPGAAPVAPAAA